MTQEGKFENRKDYTKAYGKIYYRKGYSVEFMPSQKYPKSSICFNAVVRDPGGKSFDCCTMKEVSSCMGKSRNITAEQFQRQMRSSDGSSFYEDAPTKRMFVAKYDSNKVKTVNNVSTVSVKKEYSPTRNNVYINMKMQDAAIMIDLILKSKTRLNKEDQERIVKYMKTLYSYIK